LNSSSVAVTSIGLPVAGERQLDCRPGAVSATLFAEDVAVLDLLTVDLGNYVASFDACFFGGASRLYVADKNAGSVLKLQPLGNVVGNVLNMIPSIPR